MNVSSTQISPTDQLHYLDVNELDTDIFPSEGWRENPSSHLVSENTLLDERYTTERGMPRFVPLDTPLPNTTIEEGLSEHLSTVLEPSQSEHSQDLEPSRLDNSFVSPETPRTENDIDTETLLNTEVNEERPTHLNTDRRGESVHPLSASTGHETLLTLEELAVSLHPIPKLTPDSLPYQFPNMTDTPHNLEGLGDSVIVCGTSQQSSCSMSHSPLVLTDPSQFDEMVDDEIQDDSDSVKLSPHGADLVHGNTGEKFIQPRDSLLLPKNHSILKTIKELNNSSKEEVESSKGVVNQDSEYLDNTSPMLEASETNEEISQSFNLPMHPVSSWTRIETMNQVKTESIEESTEEVDEVSDKEYSNRSLITHTNSNVIQIDDSIEISRTGTVTDLDLTSTSTLHVVNEDHFVTDPIMHEQEIATQLTLLTSEFTSTA